MGKKTAALFMSFVLAFGLCPGAAFASNLSAGSGKTVIQAATSGEWGGCTWTVDGGRLTISPTPGSTGQLEGIDYGSFSYPWSKFSSSVTSVVVASGVELPIDAYGMFEGFAAMTSCDLSKASATQTGRMDSMFYGCKKLASISLPASGTPAATGMNGMFQDCSSLASIDVSKLSTSKVEDMQNMFSGCSSLKSVNLSSFNTANVTNMGYMFRGCKQLTALDLTSFKTTKAESVESMFEGCKALTSVNISSFSTAAAETKDMFKGCSKLKTVVLGSASKLGTYCDLRDGAWTRTSPSGKFSTSNLVKRSGTAATAGTWNWTKNDNPMKVSGRTITVTLKKLAKKKKLTYDAVKLKAGGCAGSVSFKKKSGNKKITVTKYGGLVVKKGLKKGNYTVKITVKADGNSDYLPGTKVVKSVVRVK